jgi:hypothetical protein
MGGIRMKNFMKNVDVEQIKDQVSELKDQVQDLHFRTPWTRGNPTSPFLYMAIGAALGWIGLALYRNRSDVANFCSECGAKLKDTWEESGLKEKTGRMFSKTKEKAQEARDAGNQMADGKNKEAYYPT